MFTRVSIYLDERVFISHPLFKEYNFLHFLKRDSKEALSVGECKCAILALIILLTVLISSSLKINNQF